MSINLLTIVLLAIYAWRPPATDCDKILEDAEREYEAGRFHLVEALAADCLPENIPREQRARALALVARTQLMQDREAEARATLSKLVKLYPNYRDGRKYDLPVLHEILTELNQAPKPVTVSSVSKSEESLFEAPAAVTVITAEQIKRRGYNDLSEVLEDLPAFDVIRGNGIFYASLYTRGYRNTVNDRTMLLIDGSAVNGLWADSIWLSRQYPMLNVDRIEVIYGPASTMYGANAFQGVINVITKQASELVENTGDYRLQSRLGYGAWNSRYLDLLATGRPNGQFDFNLALRLFRSDEPDRSGYADWDYDYDTAVYFPGSDAEEWERENARQMDKALLKQGYSGRPISYDDLTDNYSLNGTLRFRNVSVNLQSMRRDEGSTGWYLDRYYAGGKNGQRWVPRQTSIKVSFAENFGNLSLNMHGRYRRDHLARGTRFIQLITYENGGLSLEELRKNFRPVIRDTLFSQSSDEIRLEAVASYQKGNLDLVGGMAFRTADIQGNYINEVTHTFLDIEGLPFNREQLTKFEDAVSSTGQFFRQQELGAFLQGSWHISDLWKVFAGGRIDNGRIRASTGADNIQVGDESFPVEGYGAVFNPRLGAVYKPGPGSVLKLIYSEAFKDASSFHRYTTGSSRPKPNPSLPPEKVKNLELAGIYFHEESRLTAELSAYAATYDNAVISVPLEEEPDKTRFVASGTLEIIGLQTSLLKDWEDFRLNGGASWIRPRNTQQDERIADIARFKLSVGIDWTARPDLGFNLRVNHVGERTREELNTEKITLAPVSAYTVAHLAVRYRPPIRRLFIQLTADNAFNQSYDHPGVRTSTGIHAERLPQPGAHLFLHLTYELGRLP
ncbi:MAG: TonB-dependent receptor [Acidobacteriota bacterium]|nr:TonB-dependent receptor [Acidobacteriota bacterium]